ncbi:MAG: hypothetical protein AAF547_21480 [Actinomycetota bacterium]
MILSGAGLAALIGLVGLFVWRLDNRRREQLLEATEDYGAEDYSW